MYRFFFASLISIFSTSWNTISVAQNYSRLDSIEKSIGRELNPTKKAEAYLTLSDEYLRVNLKSLDYAFSALKIAQKQENPIILVESLIAIAKGKYLLLDSYDEAKKFFTEAEEVCKSNQLFDLHIETLIQESILEQHYNHYQSALEKLKTANSKCLHSNNVLKQVTIANKISELHLSFHKYPDALSWSNTCDSLARLSKDTLQLGNSFKIKALVNSHNQLNEGVFYEYRKTITLYKKYLKSDKKNSQSRIFLYANCLIDYASALRDIKQYDSSLFYLNQCLEFIRLKYGRDTISYDPQHLMIQAYLAKSITLYAQTITPELRTAKDAIAEYLEMLTDTLALSDAYYTMANYHFKAGPVSRAISNLKTYLNLIRKLDNPLKTIEGYNKFGLAYLQLGNYKTAIGAYKGGLKISQKYKFKAKQVDLHTSIGNAYLLLEEPDSAISHAKYVKKDREKDRDSLIEYVNSYCLAAAYIMKDDLQTAKQHIYKLISLSQNTNRPILTKYGLVETDYRIAYYYKQIGNYPLFLDYINRSIKKAQDEGIKEVESDSYLLLAKYYTSIGKHEKSNEYLEKYETLKDLMINLYNQRLLTLYELNDRTNARKVEIQLLKKEREIQDAEIRYNRIILFYTIVAIAILLALLGMLFVINRRKNRAYQMLAAQTNEILEKNRLLAEQTIAIEKSEFMIKKQNQELVSLNRTKDKFFSIIAHDLRNPFSGLIGLTNYLILQFKDITIEETKKYLLAINESSRQTFILLENLLEWAQTQLESIKYNPEAFDLFNVAENAKKLFSATITIKEIIIVNQIHPETWVFADKTMIETILRNLISNALKFTNSKGHVELFTIMIDGKVQVGVRDSGMGISSEYLEKLFSLETITSRDGTSHEKGTGLGLIVCKEMIKKHDERIWAESNLGEGATFFFTLKSTTA